MAVKTRWVAVVETPKGGDLQRALSGGSSVLQRRSPGSSAAQFRATKIPTMATLLGVPFLLPRVGVRQEARTTKADGFAVQLATKVAEYRNHGISTLNGIVAKLNADSIMTARGKTGTWAPTAVRNLLARL